MTSLSSPPTGNALPIAFVLVVFLILCIIGIIIGIITLLRLLYRNIKKQNRSCGYCFDRNIMCYHDEEYATTQQARYCPMCGRKL